MNSRTKLGIEYLVQQWLDQNEKQASEVQHMNVPVGFIGVLLEHRDEPRARHPNNWHTARTFPQRKGAH